MCLGRHSWAADQSHLAVSLGRNHSVPDDDSISICRFSCSESWRTWLFRSLLTLLFGASMRFSRVVSLRASRAKSEASSQKKFEQPQQVFTLSLLSLEANLRWHTLRFNDSQHQILSSYCRQSLLSRTGCTKQQACVAEVHLAWFWQQQANTLTGRSRPVVEVTRVDYQI